MESLKRGFRRLRVQFEENPQLVLILLVALFTATAKLISSYSAAQNSRTWRKEVNRRIQNQSTKK
jgi:hypothetical protein